MRDLYTDFFKLGNYLFAIADRACFCDMFPPTLAQSARILIDESLAKLVHSFKQSKTISTTPWTSIQKLRTFGSGSFALSTGSLFQKCGLDSLAMIDILNRDRQSNHHRPTLPNILLSNLPKIAQNSLLPKQILIQPIIQCPLVPITQYLISLFKKFQFGGSGLLLFEGLDFLFF